MDAWLYAFAGFVAGFMFCLGIFAVAAVICTAEARKGLDKEH